MGTTDLEEKSNKFQSPIRQKGNEINYIVIIIMFYSHVAAVHGIYLCFDTKWMTLIFFYVLGLSTIIGVAAGAHRLWSHRSYKAKWPLQVFLLILFSTSFQYSIIHWVKDHRMHHKHSDTDADPHNSRRGFFFSHIGWLLMPKNEEVKTKGKLMDFSDVYNNPLLQFHDKYAWLINGILCFILPTSVAVYFLEETFISAWNINMLRFIVIMHITVAINSLNHNWGYRPYDKNIYPAQNIFVTLFSLGEGFHNFHHVYPWDYRSAELGNNMLNVITIFIDFCAWIGLAYDRKWVSNELIKARMMKTGDGTNLWGWEDKDRLRESDFHSYGKSLLVDNDHVLIRG